MDRNSVNYNHRGEVERSTIGAFLIFLLIACFVGVYKFAEPYLADRKLKNTSDASKQNSKVTPIRFGGDNYLGYWFITSPEMQKQSVRQGFGVEFNDDKGAYAERLTKFAASEYDMIVLPVNSYLQHGANHKYPGVIVAAIAESRGADGIVGFANRFHSFKPNDLNDSSLKVVYTGESPSSFLFDLTMTSFGLDRLRGDNSWRVEVSGSDEVYKRAKANQGDVFVLWEPDLSKALELPGVQYLWGSDKFSKYIVDVFVVHRDFLSNNKAAVTAFFKTYFRVMSTYTSDRDRLVKEMSSSTSLKVDVVKTMIPKIKWFDLRENCQEQFGLNIASANGVNPDEGVLNTIISCLDVLKRTGKFQGSLPKNDPYMILNSEVLDEVSKNAVMGLADQSGAPTKFEPLDKQGWSRLKEVATLRVEPINFQTGNNSLSFDGKLGLDAFAPMLTNNYPSYRVVVRGHTGPGDEVENVKLSTLRAQAVAKYLAVTHKIDPNRLLAQGVGASVPLARRPDESQRAYQYRLPRVEFVLFEEHL